MGQQKLLHCVRRQNISDRGRLDLRERLAHPGSHSSNRLLVRFFSNHICLLRFRFVLFFVSFSICAASSSASR